MRVIGNRPPIWLGAGTLQRVPQGARGPLLKLGLCRRSWSIASHWAKFESVPEHDVHSVANASGWHYLHLRVLPSEWRPGAHTVACSGSGQKTCVRRGETKAKVKVLSIVTC